MPEEIDEQEEIDGEQFDDLESNPSGSLRASRSDDIQMKADEITAVLLQEILDDFNYDENVKLEVEDNIDEEDFEDKWPYSLDKVVEEKPPPQPKPLAQAPPAAAEEPKQDQPENEAKKKFD